MEKQAGSASAARPPRPMAEAWARIRGRLREEVGEVEYRTWLRQMTLAGIEGDEAIVVLPTRFLRDWVRSHYGDRLQRAVAGGERRRCAASTCASAPQRGSQRRAEDGDGAGAAGAATPRRRGARAWPEPLAAPAARRPNRAGGCARRLVRAARSALHLRHLRRRQAERIRPCLRAPRRRAARRSPGFNPLFLYGGVGLGKTHLMHAIAWAIRERRRRRRNVAYMSAEKFMYRFIAALRSQSTMEFKEALRVVDVLMVDDLQFLIGKDNTQEEFFHTFNALVDAGKQIVVSADKSPSDLAGIEDRLRTRLGCGMVADLHATTYELRLSILQAKAAAAGRGGAAQACWSSWRTRSPPTSASWKAR